MGHKAVIMVVLLMVSTLGPGGLAATGSAQTKDVAAAGNVTITADPATDGSTFSYNLPETDSIGSITTTLTGVDNTQTTSDSGLVLGGSGTISTTVGGTTAPSNEILTISGSQTTYDYEASGTEIDTGAGDSSTTIPTGDVETIGSIKILMSDESGSGSTLDLSINGTQMGTDSLAAGGRSYLTFDDANVSVGSGAEISVSGGDVAFDSSAGVDDLTLKSPTPSSISATTSSGTVEFGTGGTESIDLSQGSQTVNFSSTAGTLNWSLSYDETTQTVDPSITVNGNSVDHSGTLSEGETTDLSVPETWIQNGTNTISVSMSSPSDGPESMVGLNYEHRSSVNISTTYQASVFEEKYNISHTYGDATADAQVSIPFDSGRVVAVQEIDYQVNDGGWTDLASDDYRFNDTTLTAELSQAYGGELPSDSTVDVRTTARKIRVNNGEVTVTNPTAPGDELDTELRVDSKSDGFNIDVGPTENGDRVHYVLSDDFGGSGPTGSVVIEANGDQHVEIPGALAGDTMRVQHLQTQVMPQSGDVRIEVKEAGSDPEIDVSPGPGGEGDPVDIKYYATQSGTEYILESLTQGIVLDSDVANSPAIFSDDDSSETWLIGLGSVGGDGTTSDSSGIVGPIQSSTGFEIPFGGPVPAFVALLGLGLTATVYFTGARGFGTLRRVGSRAGSATRSSIPVIGGILGRLVSGGLTLLSLGGSGLVQLARYLRARPTLGTLVTVGLVLSAVVSGVVPVPEGTTIAIFAVAVPLVSFVVLRRLDQFSPLVWGGTSAIGLIVSLVLLGVEFGSLINEQTSLILAVGGLWLAYQAVQAYREGNITNVVIPGRRGGDGQ